MQFFIKVIVLSLLIILTAIHLLDYWMMYADEDIKSELGDNCKVYYVSSRGSPIRVVAVPNDKVSPVIIFIHGAPGGWDAYKWYMKDSSLQARATLVAYDRPGYGYDPSEAMPKIKDQSEALEDIIALYSDKEVILVGHSYGGPIAAHVAASQPDLVDAICMIAPVIAPDAEKIWWFSYFSKCTATKWLLPNSYQVAGTEKFAHTEELEKLDSLWNQIRIPIVHIHGEKDWLAPAKANIGYSLARLPESNTTHIFYKDEGHILLWTNPELVRSNLYDVLGYVH